MPDLRSSAVRVGTTLAVWASRRATPAWIQTKSSFALPARTPSTSFYPLDEYLLIAGRGSQGHTHTTASDALQSRGVSPPRLRLSWLGRRYGRVFRGAHHWTQAVRPRDRCGRPAADRVYVARQVGWVRTFSLLPSALYPLLPNYHCSPSSLLFFIFLLCFITLRSE